MESMNQISYKVNESIKAEELSEVFKTSGIKRPSDDLNRLQQMIDNSNVLITAWYNNQLIGVARAITDYCYCCYLSDLAVNKNYQNRGIGKELVRLLKEHNGDEVALLLLSSPIAMEYYPKIGFEKIENGFKIPRKK
ncbi:GNAT family N-acetyltransferase [Niallia circulans]|jgi:ribosomal protein S18 acetylase RimI-like enzyme|uniref:GNAT family N-acetyltransferase n=1 Tax=Niallia circulans TaxID=1397 RepID=UPI000F45492F|nr:GNAT family N-acetyltransferase [Niallia circulans]AYV69681.1 GNAT family N-acetyltransferase [Niallia circulans]AYV71931.1 GNAT family N-acetyltransferase [Niallia circulans]